MRMMLKITFPHEPFNEAIRNGTAGRPIARILEMTRPESVYFTEWDGHRGAVVVVDIADPSQVPAFSEPWFLTFNADVKFNIAMKPEDLQRSGLEELGKKWGLLGPSQG